MPGGPACTWDVMKPIFESIAAKVDGEPCVTHIGPGGAGHYVKMVHNGIEYGDMQLICEAYNIFKNGRASRRTEMAKVFDEWNEGRAQSYLIQITGKRWSRRIRRPASRSSISSSTRPARRAPASGRSSTRRRMRSSFPPSMRPSRRASFQSMKDSAWPPARNSRARRRATSTLERRHSCKRSTMPCTHARSLATPRASTSSRPWAKRRTGASTSAASPRSGAAAASSARDSSTASPMPIAATPR